ncbi:MAG TPA: dihydroorotate dehydrogenase electron transfer subunit [Vicinamibacterales bacterium]
MPVDLDAAVIANTRLSDEYHVLSLAAPEIAERTAPGQFVMVKPGRGVEPLLRRPFSVFEILRNAQGAPVGISILSKRIGVGTGLLYGLEPGDRLACLGPLGRPFTTAPADRPVWFVAGGVGLAPFATMAEACLARGIRPRLFYGARRAGDLYYADWFRDRAVEVVVATEDGSAGTKGFVTAPLGAALEAESGASPFIYCCGPTPMMRAVATLAAAKGHHDVEVSLEQQMGCGLGGCYSCVVRVKRDGAPPHFVRSCIAGPTFRAAEVVWEELAH